MTALCIPAEADRGRDVYCVLWNAKKHPSIFCWRASESVWTGHSFDDPISGWTPEHMTALGYRYGGPAPEAKESEG